MMHRFFEGLGELVSEAVDPKKDDDSYIPIDIYEEDDPEAPPVSAEQFMRELYDVVKLRARRDDRGVYREDFMYASSRHESDDGQAFWWIPDAHPVARMLFENNETSNGAYQDLGLLKTTYGGMIIYEESMVNECLDCLVGLCRDYDLKILE